MKSGFIFINFKRKHPQFCEMAMRETRQTSKVLEMRSFYKVWVTSVLGKNRFFMRFSTFVLK
jgi:hypothetical protein